MRLRQIDLLGQGFGALVAAEVAATRPGQVRRLVVVSPPPASDSTEQPPALTADGSHLLEEWHRAVTYCGPDASPEAATAVLAERLRNGAQAAAAAAAERGYPLRARLTQLSIPLLVLRLREEIAANRGQARDMPARARLVELPERGASIFETAPEAAAQALETFLR
jgi:pimeloyl-ACP methyl ester carboxylesterase